MKTINPNETSYVLLYIPREYNDDDVSVDFTREYGSVSVTADNLATTTNTKGYKVVTLDLSTITLKEGDSFIIKVYQNLTILYRCKVYITASTNLQNFNYEQ